MRKHIPKALILFLSMLSAIPLTGWAKTKIVLIAGRDSHGSSAHNWGDGVDLLSNALVKESGLAIETAIHKGGWPTDPAIFKDAAARIDQQVRGGCFGRQQLVQCGFSSRTCHTGDASRFTYESGDTLLHLGNRNASSPAFLCELLAQGASIHAKNSKGETAEELDKPRMREAQRLFKLKPRAKKKKAAKKVEGNQSALVGATFGDVVGVANRGTKLARLMRSGVA